MRIVEDFETTRPFEVLAPARQRIPFVFDSPHSGTSYPRAFLAASRLDARRIRRSEDAFVDQLFAGVVELGAPLMRAHFPRAYLDVNREPYELDPKMFAGRLPPYANVRSVRVAGGLGTIARVVSEAEEIYAAPLDVAAALDRIDALYKPYHAALRRLLSRTREGFGYAVLIDCHSMPSNVRASETRHRADFVVGDRYGTSCARALTERCAEFLRALGYSVSLNKPYAGGFITEHYGQPAKGVHALQVEVNRGLYMDEGTFAPSAGFERVARDLGQLVAVLSELPRALFTGEPEAEAAE